MGLFLSIVGTVLVLYIGSIWICQKILGPYN